MVGLASSGFSCANLLHDLGSRVSVTDNKDDAPVRCLAKKLKDKNIFVETGKHSKDLIQKSDLLVLSPGVTPVSQPVLWAKEKNIPAISEIEVGWMLCDASIIAVTGSNGKTTVTTLIGKIIEASSRRVFVCGNIGTPFTSLVKKMRPEDFVSLEVSSFQLESCYNFRPKIALILNFNRNHLDRHKDMREYLEAKKRIFINQGPSDYLVLNSKDKLLKKVSKSALSEIVWYEPDGKLNPNQQAVIKVGELLGIARKTCLKVFSAFKGLAHRMEFVAKKKGVSFINDSKATTVESCVWALRNINSDVVLIAGGKDKGVDYGLMLKEAAGKVRLAVLIGEAKDKIRRCIFKKIPVIEASSMRDAVVKAFLNANSGDYVLLSPMCSSFDMFDNYKQRGEVFKKEVLKL